MFFLGQILDCCTLVFVSLLEERAFLALTERIRFFFSPQHCSCWDGRGKEKRRSYALLILCIEGNGRRRGAYRSSTRSVRPNVKDLGSSCNPQDARVA